MSPALNVRGPGRAGLSALAAGLSERDQRVLEEVQRHRFLTTDHVRRLVFVDHRSLATAARVCRQTLTRLQRDRLIRPLPRRVGGLHGGAAFATWQLTGTGHRLLGLIRGEGAISRSADVGQLFIHHYLAIADVHVLLLEADRAEQFELLELALEPACWRRYTDGSGSAQVLKPDLFAVTATAEYEDHWFIEVDRGTEGLPTLLRQCRAYQQYRASGSAQADDGGVFPRVIWLLPTERRRDRLRAAIAGARGLDPALFHTLTLDQLLPLLTGVPS